MVNLLKVASESQPTLLNSNPVQEEDKKFASIFKDAIINVNEAEIQSDIKTNMLANGEIQDLHEVMITAQKASITLEATVQVQSKVIDAYNEIMRMQV